MENNTTDIVEPKPKQFLLMVEAPMVGVLHSLMPGLMFVEVNGVEHEAFSGHAVLCNPIPKPEPKAIEPTEIV